MVVYVDEARCTGCGLCIKTCPLGAIDLVGNVATIDQERCTGCEACVETCPNGAIMAVTEERAPLPSRQQAAETLPALRQPPPAPQRTRLLPILGATMAFLGREIAPRLAAYMVDTLDRHLSQRSAGLPVERPPVSAASGQQRGGRRFRRRRRGR